MSGTSRLTLQGDSVKLNTKWNHNHVAFKSCQEQSKHFCDCMGKFCRELFVVIQNILPNYKFFPNTKDISIVHCYIYRNNFGVPLYPLFYIKVQVEISNAFSLFRNKNTGFGRGVYLVIKCNRGPIPTVKEQISCYGTVVL